jgi:hypothetical protein
MYKVCYWDAEAKEQRERDATPEEAAEIDARKVAPPPVPQTVTRRQAKQALLLAGKLASVQPAIDAITDPTQRAMMQLEWDESQEFQRQRPALLMMASAIGLDSAGLDQLFITAAGL